jgi:hypothetical protein
MEQCSSEPEDKEVKEGYRIYYMQLTRQCQMIYEKLG